MKDCVLGKVDFILVRIKIKHMELGIIKREIMGSGANATTESDTITKFEVMDGAPGRGEEIPIRLYLSPYELTPTYKNINNKFSVKYYLNLVLIDEEDRRYFRIQDHIGVSYRLLNEAEYHSRKIASQYAEIPALDELSAIEQQLELLFEKVKIRSTEVAEMGQLLNQKLKILNY